MIKISREPHQVPYEICNHLFQLYVDNGCDLKNIQDFLYDFEKIKEIWKNLRFDENLTLFWSCSTNSNMTFLEKNIVDIPFSDFNKRYKISINLTEVRIEPL